MFSAWEGGVSVEKRPYKRGKDKRFRKAKKEIGDVGEGKRPSDSQTRGFLR